MTSLPTVASDVVVADFGSELVVLVPSRRRAHLLEPIWSLLFDSCRLGHATEDLCAELIRATRWSEEETLQWLNRAVSELERSGVVSA